jgi:hypothetical protein
MKRLSPSRKSSAMRLICDTFRSTVRGRDRPSTDLMIVRRIFRTQRGVLLFR